MARSLCLLALSMVLGFGALRTADADDDAYERALLHYKERLGDDALGSRNSGRVSLALTKDERALRILQRDYANPEPPRDEVRYLIAETASFSFDAEFADEWDDWMEDESDPDDAWLWFQGQAACLRVGPSEIRRLVSAEEDVFLRAAALEALSVHVAQEQVPATEVVGRILDEIQTLPEGAERGILVGSLAAVGLSLQPYLTQVEVRQAIAQVIKQVDNEDTPAWARLAVARRMAKLTGMPSVTLRTQYMLDALEGTAQPESATDKRYAHPRFMGVEATGTRICYVIDCSDSMLAPLSHEEKQALRAPARNSGMPERGTADQRPLPDQLDWDRIDNRFDAAREFLKLSLATLTRDQSFAIVCFGSKAAPLKRVAGMRRASKTRVRQAVAALSAMKATSPTARRTHGRLMGDTNLHAAIRLAFRVIPSGVIRRLEHVDERGFADGCDTIFLLTDGVPTVDDYTGTRVGLRLVGGKWRDPETGTEGGSGNSRLKRGHMRVKGPYASSGSRWLEGDVQRMNMFRKVEIHCVGLGEADGEYLTALASLGLGSVLMIGTNR